MGRPDIYALAFAGSYSYTPGEMSENFNKQSNIAGIGEPNSWRDNFRGHGLSGRPAGNGTKPKYYYQSKDGQYHAWNPAGTFLQPSATHVDWGDGKGIQSTGSGLDSLMRNWGKNQSGYKPSLVELARDGALNAGATGSSNYGGTQQPYTDYPWSQGGWARPNTQPSQQPNNTYQPYTNQTRQKDGWQMPNNQPQFQPFYQPNNNTSNISGWIAKQFGNPMGTDSLMRGMHGMGGNSQSTSWGSLLNQSMTQNHTKSASLQDAILALAYPDQMSKSASGDTVCNTIGDIVDLNNVPTMYKWAARDAAQIARDHRLAAENAAEHRRLMRIAQSHAARKWNSQQVTADDIAKYNNAEGGMNHDRIFAGSPELQASYQAAVRAGRGDEWRKDFYEGNEELGNVRDAFYQNQNPNLPKDQQYDTSAFMNKWDPSKMDTPQAAQDRHQQEVERTLASYRQNREASGQPYDEAALRQQAEQSVRADQRVEEAAKQRGGYIPPEEKDQLHRQYLNEERTADKNRTNSTMTAQNEQNVRANVDAATRAAQARGEKTINNPQMANYYRRQEEWRNNNPLSAQEQREVQRKLDEERSLYKSMGQSAMFDEEARRKYYTDEAFDNKYQSSLTRPGQQQAQPAQQGQAQQGQQPQVQANQPAQQQGQQPTPATVQSQEQHIAPQGQSGSTAQQGQTPQATKPQAPAAQPTKPAPSATIKPYVPSGSSSATSGANKTPGTATPGTTGGAAGKVTVNMNSFKRPIA